MVLAVESFTLAVAFFLVIPPVCLGAAVDLVSGFYRSGHLPSVGHFKPLRSLRDLLRRGRGCVLSGGVVVALTTRPLGRRGTKPRPRESARLKDWPAGLSGHYVGLWWPSFVCVRALALHDPPSPPTTLNSHGSSLRVFAHSHRNESVTAG